MILEAHKLLDEYINWIKDNTFLREIDDWVEITSPYLDRHNDYIQIYIKRKGKNFFLTDDGYTIQDLKHSGCELASKKRKALLNLTLNGFGIKRDGNALTTMASINDFAFKKHNLIQAMLAVNDLFYLSDIHIKSLFYEDVTEWLDLHEIRYTPDVKFSSASGFDYLFNFVIPKSKTQPERILKLFNEPSRDNAKKIILAWYDTKEARPEKSKIYTVINDLEKEINIDVIEKLKNCEITPIPWSLREDYSVELAA